MSYGLSTRGVGGPTGVKQRYGRVVRYVPLSKFFLDREKEAKETGDDEDALYGLKEPERASKTEACQYDPQKCMYCDAGASRALVYAGGRGYIPCCRAHVNKGSMRIWRTLKEKIHARRRIPLKHRLKEGQPVAQGENLTGMTSTATVGTTAVPIGPGIKHISDVLDFGPGHPHHKKKKRRKKLSALLRRVM